MNVLQHTRNELNLSQAKSTGPLLQRHSLNGSKEFANIFRRSLFQAFGQDKENSNVTTYKQNEPSIILLHDGYLINLRWFMIWHR